mmetsp:Transcript_41165/g.129305  ORF Transcript_41165/g.129305 Transcript_41165/m.129305 type:complete len:235 (-) Transcript_41165:4-708(-)
MDGGHKAFLDSPLVVDTLHKGRKAVGGAGGAGDEVGLALVVIGVDSHDNSEGVVLGWSRKHNLLHASINVGLRLLSSQEDSGRLAEVLDSSLGPSNVLGVTGTGGDDALSIDDEIVTIDNNVSVVASVDGIVLELVGHVVRGGRSSVDLEELGLRILDHDTSNKAADTSKAVDTAGDSLHGGAGHLSGLWLGSGSIQARNKGRSWVEGSRRSESSQVGNGLEVRHFCWDHDQGS